MMKTCTGATRDFHAVTPLQRIRLARPFTILQDGELLDEFVFDTDAAMLSLKPNEQP